MATYHTHDDPPCPSDLELEQADSLHRWASIRAKVKQLRLNRADMKALHAYLTRKLEEIEK